MRDMDAIIKFMLRDRLVELDPIVFYNTEEVGDSVLARARYAASCENMKDNTAHDRFVTVEGPQISQVFIEKYLSVTKEELEYLEKRGLLYKGSFIMWGVNIFRLREGYRPCWCGTAPKGEELLALEEAYQKEFSDDRRELNICLEDIRTSWDTNIHDVLLIKTISGNKPDMEVGERVPLPKKEGYYTRVDIPVNSDIEWVAVKRTYSGGQWQDICHWFNIYRFEKSEIYKGLRFAEAYKEFVENNSQQAVKLLSASYADNKKVQRHIDYAASRISKRGQDHEWKVVLKMLGLNLIDKVQWNDSLTGLASIPIKICKRLHLRVFEDEPVYDIKEGGEEKEEEEVIKID